MGDTHVGAHGVSAIHLQEVILSRDICAFGPSGLVSMPSGEVSETIARTIILLA